jgi:hypothetical protein
MELNVMAGPLTHLWPGDWAVNTEDITVSVDGKKVSIPRGSKLLTFSDSLLNGRRRCSSNSIEFGEEELIPITVSEPPEKIYREDLWEIQNRLGDGWSGDRIWIPGATATPDYISSLAVYYEHQCIDRSSSYNGDDVLELNFFIRFEIPAKCLERQSSGHGETGMSVFAISGQGRKR